MLQREVVERMTAAPGGKDYGRLTVMLAAAGALRSAVRRGPRRLQPSSQGLVDGRPHHAARGPPFPVRDHGRFAKLVAHLFSMRRKTLGRSLKGA